MSPLIIAGSAAAAIALLAGTYLAGRGDGAALCRAAIAEAVIAEQKRVAAAGAAVLEKARADMAAAEKAAAVLEQKVRDYEAEISARADACVIGDADARRLRSIR